MAVCLTTERFWQLKVSQPAVYEVVIVGNSKVNMGLSPRHLSRASGRQKIFNFGFVACCLNKKYLKHASALLDPNISDPTLVLGICPHCFFRPSPINGYNYWSSQSVPQREAIMRQAWMENVSLKAIAKTSARNLQNLTKGLPLSYYFPDGWEACYPGRMKHPEMYAESSKKLLTRFRVQPRIVTEFLEAVYDIHQEGITLYGYRPPCSASVRELESGKGGVDFQELSKSFEQAGGKWIDIDPVRYQSFDGAHLDFRNAMRLSQEVGAAMRP
ncbi:hypothetical protein FAK_21650 [Desulfoferula mesophila]|uniref:Uncharacterized protein n=1 Tax=Desulfoferula mesophila TaxID=3058419 RepID=A0AAU9EPL9_9BACT|nr:hypothetical protein FAK_21650 [Desulfoferula mesophilus]